MFNVSVVWSSTDENVMHYVLPVLWITSCFHIKKPMGQNPMQHYVWSNSPGDGSGEVMSSV